jgi:hypothetical protein
MKRLLVPMAVAMTGLYLLLAIAAAGCLSLHAASSTTAHHHTTSHVTHSALCAWACQANPTAAGLSVVPTQVLFALLLLLPLLITVFTTCVSCSLSLSRAPPR